MKTRNFLNGFLLVITTAVISFSCYKSKNDYNNGSGNIYKVSIKNSGFTPATVTVVAGSTVSWKNDDTMIHGVTTADGSISSGDIAAGGTYTKTFSAAGTFNYYDTHNNSMTGVIIVTGTSSGY